MFKSSAQKRDGVWHDVSKSPLDSTKTSKPGRLKLVKNGDKFETVRIETDGVDLLETVFLNGDIVKRYTFEEVRNVSNQ